MRINYILSPNGSINRCKSRERYNCQALSINRKTDFSFMPLQFFRFAIEFLTIDMITGPVIAGNYIARFLNNNLNPPSLDRMCLCPSIAIFSLLPILCTPLYLEISQTLNVSILTIPLYFLFVFGHSIPIFGAFQAIPPGIPLPPQFNSSLAANPNPL